MNARDYDYHGRRNDGYYQDDGYYERRCNYDEGFKFNPKLDILEFDGGIDIDEFLDLLNMAENVSKYYDPLERKRVKLVAIKMCKSASIW